MSAIKISWHPHYAIYPCELRDWSLLSWHPHPTICLLRQWVSEWESTGIQERTAAGVVPWTVAGRMQEWRNSREGAVEPREPSKRDRDAQMNWRNSEEASQMLTTDCSIRSVGKERMIFLFNSSTLQGDCHFVEEFLNFEQRISNDQSQRDEQTNTEFR